MLIFLAVWCHSIHALQRLLPCSLHSFLILFSPVLSFSVLFIYNFEIYFAQVATFLGIHVNPKAYQYFQSTYSPFALNSIFSIFFVYAQFITCTQWKLQKSIEKFIFRKINTVLYLWEYIFFKAIQPWKDLKRLELIRQQQQKTQGLSHYIFPVSLCLFRVILDQIKIKNHPICRFISSVFIWPSMVLLHNGGYCNACTIKRSITILCIP